MGKNQSSFVKGHIVPKEVKAKISQSLIGRKLPKKTRDKMSCSHKGMKFSKEHIRNAALTHTGEKCNWWKGGISKRKDYLQNYRDKNREKVRLWNRVQAYRRKAAGQLTIKMVQKIYEDNIKKYGTLTCVYCLEPIEFGKDTLDHRFPISKGGTNRYSNLVVACRSCNSKKGDKLEKEFRKGLKWQL